MTMTTTGSGGRLKVSDVIERYGKCLELVPTDPHFHDITVGLYVKEDTGSLWSFSRRPGTEDRLRQIRDQMVALGGMTPVKGAHNQVMFLCGHLHPRLLKFLLAQAVGKSPDYSPVTGELSIKDYRTDLTLKASGTATDGRWVYHISGEGDAPSIPARLRAVVAGFVRYGEMDKVGETEVSFPCGARHQQLMRILMPYSRNVSAVESMMEEQALRGQMTTGTLGFTPT